jgi:hypothetical protein
MATKKEVTPKEMKRIVEKLPAEFTKEIALIFVDYLEDHQENLPKKARKRLKKIGQEKD